MLRSQAYYCDVTPPGIDKGRLVDLLAERLGVPREEIAVLGDMGNDVEMFRRAGFAIAMGNATPEVKALAQAITLVERRRRLRRRDRALHPRQLTEAARSGGLRRDRCRT